MIYIDGKEIDWSLVGNENNAIEKYSRPHTWTIAPHLIKYDFANGRIQCPDYGVPSKYSSMFCYPHNKKKAVHSVEYSVQRIPHPTNSALTLNDPPTMMIIGGYMQDVVDNEINFFHTFAPWVEDGVAYDKRQETKTYLYNADKVRTKAETDAEITMKVLNKIVNLKGPEVIAMARTISLIPGRKLGISISENELNSGDPVRYNNHVTNLKNAIFKFAQVNPQQLKNMLGQKQSQVFAIYEEAIDSGVIKFDSEGAVLPVQGMWRMIKDNEKVVDICPVNDVERPVDVITSFLAKPKSEALLEEIKTQIAIATKEKQNA